MKRRLSAEERELWRRLTETVRPRIVAPEPEEGKPTEIPDVPGDKAVARKAATPSAPASTPPAPAKPREMQPPALEPRTRRRLSRGNLDVDARIDLHGMTQERAHHALRTFLDGSRARGHRIVLVITGKGGGEARGILRRAVPLWLAGPDFRDLVAGLEAAGRRHGGEGALYVRLRRASR